MANVFTTYDGYIINKNNFKTYYSGIELSIEIIKIQFSNCLNKSSYIKDRCNLIFYPLMIYKDEVIALMLLHILYGL